MNTLLKVSGLVSGYGAIEVLHEVSLEVGKGEIVSVIGANGAGKTTLLLTISGHLRAKQGSIEFDGRSVTRAEAHEAPAAGITMVPEGGRLFPFMTVLENIELGAFHARARANMRDNLEYVLTMFPILAERRLQLAGQLSGGERQMCAIARAVMSEPRLLMLDEPSLGLAPIMVERVFELTRSLVADRHLTVLLVEQNVADALEMSARAYILERGRINRSGEASGMLDDPEIRRAYLGI